MKKKIDYFQITWCLLQFEEVLMRHRDRYIWFRNKDHRYLHMHFNRIERIQIAFDYFHEKEFRKIIRKR